MLSKLSFAAVLLTFGQLCYAQVPFAGPCPDVQAVQEFDLNAYTGLWYEQSKYPFIFELGQRCIYARYADIGNNKISVSNTGTNRLTGKPLTIDGYGNVLGPGRLAVVFKQGQKDDVANYEVLSTDYKNYSVVYACTNISNIFHTRVVWILTRERRPSAETIAAAKKVMDEKNLSQSYLIDTIQDNCPDVNETNNNDSASSSSDYNYNYVENA